MTVLSEPIGELATDSRALSESQASDIAESAARADSPSTLLGWVDRLLRDRAGLLAAIESGADLARIAKAMVLTIILAGAAFGVAIGAFRGGWQVLFAGVKIPLVLLLTASVCTPVLTALRRVVVGVSDLRRDLALLLAALAFASLVQAALVPVFVLALRAGAAYHDLILLAVGVYGAGGLAGLTLFWRGLRRGGRRGGGLVAMAMIGVFLVVATQMAWVLRPYLVRPRTPQPPIVRELEGSALDAVFTSMRSAAGIYENDDAGWERGR